MTRDSSNDSVSDQHHTDARSENDEFQRIIDETTELAFSCYHELVADQPGANRLYSPTSVLLALAMTYAGARGETKTQIRDVMGFPDDEEALHAAFEQLQREFARLHDLEEVDLSREYDESDDPHPFTLSIANTLWGQTGYPFRDAYLDVLADHYDGGLREIDFGADPAGARETINRWVADETNDRITNLLPKPAITPLTRFVIVNAVYFKANWKDPFSESSTRPAEFTAIDGTTHEVPMMKDKRTWRYAAVDGAEAVELPYVDDRIAMVVILPPEGKFEAYERSFDADAFATICRSLSKRFGIVRLPRFEFDSLFELEETFRAMGMVAPFDEANADFGAMIETGESVALDEVYHEASIDVDETGTEAAAATAVVGEGVGAVFSDDEIRFVANRPFLFVIRDRETGAPLFVGRAVDPAEWQ